VFPSSSSSRTLSESEPWESDTPCKSPACPPERELGPVPENPIGSPRRLALRPVRLLAAKVFPLPALARAIFFFFFPVDFLTADFLGAFDFFGALDFVVRDLVLFGPAFLDRVALFLLFFLMAIRAV